MSESVVLSILLVPLALLALLAIPDARRIALMLAPWAAAPALLAAVAIPSTTVELPWLLLGTTLGIDATRQIFLILTAGLWTASGIYAGGYHASDPHRARLFAFHLATLTGNLGLVLALDAVSFYLFFVLMSFSAFGLIVHDGSAEARRAGRVYIMLVIIGELMILPGLWSAVGAAPSTMLDDVSAAAVGSTSTALLLALGFAVKAGVVPLHVWLPLAHPVAPTPSSAVLSGAMIKAGALAWLVLLPVGDVPQPLFAASFMAAGAVNAIFGAAVGVCQTRPKTVLAYSSISQMGFIMFAVGIGFLHDELWPLALVAASAYCLHHAFAKGALFLGVGIVEKAASERLRRRALWLLAIPALAIVGAPLTTGYAAKHALKEAVHAVPSDLAGTLEIVIPAATIGTTLLMVRYFWLMRAVRPKEDAAGALMWTPWLALGAAGLILPWTAALPHAIPADSSSLWSALWPILAGIGLAGLAAWWLRRQVALPDIPEGDILSPISRLLRAQSSTIAGMDQRVTAASQRSTETARSTATKAWRATRERTRAMEAALGHGPIVALNILALIAAILVLAATS